MLGGPRGQLVGAAQKEEMEEMREQPSFPVVLSMEHIGKSGSEVRALQLTAGELWFRSPSFKALDMDRTDPVVGAAPRGVNFARGRQKQKRLRGGGARP